MILTWFIVVLILIGSACLTLYVGRRTGCIRQTAVALIVQVLLSTIFLSIWGLREDALTYHNAAILFVETWSNGTELTYTLPEGKRSTVLIAGFFYWMVGPYPIVVLMFAATITAWLPALLATATKLFGFQGGSNLAAWLGALAPPMLLWAPWLTRESLAFVLLGIATVVFGRVYQRKFSLLTLMIWILTAYAMSVTRPQLLLVLAMGTLASLLLSRKPSDAGRTARERTGLATAIVLGTALSFSAVWWVFGSSDTGRTVQPDERAAIVSELSGPESTLGVRYESESSPNTIEPDSIAGLNGEPSPQVHANTGYSGYYAYFQRGLNSLFGPFPWHWKSAPIVLAGLDGILMALVWILIAYGAIKYSNTRRITCVLIAACFPLMAGEAYFHANYGITLRVRAHYLILLLPLIATITVATWPSIKNIGGRFLNAQNTHTHST